VLERAKGVEVVQRIYGARGGHPERVVVSDAAPAQVAAFWAALGGSEADVQEAVPDEEAAAGSGSHLLAGGVQLYRVSDASGALTVTPIPRGADGRVRRNSLPAGDVAIVDAGTDVYAWTSKTASPAERASALRVAIEFAEGRAAGVDAALAAARAMTHARASVVRDGGEPPVFKSLFYQWDAPVALDLGKAKGLAPAAAGGAGASAPAAAVLSAADVRAVLAHKAAAQDLGSEAGTTTAWIVQVSGAWWWRWTLVAPPLPA
jgi:hypothetical protein